MPKKPGLIIALDGPDGVGKTTQLELLCDHLKGLNRTVRTARASGGTPIGEELRKVSLSHNYRPAATDVHISLAMFSALAEELRTQKSQGETILIDRSPLAMIAYNAYGGHLPDEASSQLEPGRQFVMGAAADTCRSWNIDLLLFLDAPQETLDERRQKRGTKDYFENQDAGFHHRVRSGYLEGLKYIKSENLPMRIAEIDASPDINTIRQTVIGAVEKYLS